MPIIGSNTIWGIDIGGSAVKAIKLRVIPPKRSRRKPQAVTPERLEILATDIVPCRGEPPPGEPNPRHTRVVNALTEFRLRNRIRDERIVAALPGSSALVRPFDAVLVGGKSIDEIVHYEISQLIPFGLDSVVWDYELFQAHEDQTKHEGLLFAVKKETLNGYLLGLNAANLEVDDVQAAPLALYNFIRHQYRPKTPLLAIDMGASCTDLVVIYGDRYWVRSAPIGGNMITRELARSFNLPFDKAEAVKQNVGKAKFQRRILEALLPALRAYVGELQNAMAAFRAQAEHVHFDKILLLGKASRTVGLHKLLTSALGGEVVTPAGFNNISLADGVDAAAVRQNVPAFAVAAGLALQGANKASTKVTLVVEGAARRRLVSRTRPFLFATSAALTLLLGSMIAFGHYRLGVLNKANEHVNETLGRFSKINMQYRNLERPTAKERRMRELEELGNRPEVWLKALADLTESLPRNKDLARHPERRIWLSDLKIEINPADKRRRICGTAGLALLREWTSAAEEPKSRLKKRTRVEAQRLIETTLIKRLADRGCCRELNLEIKGTAAAPRRSREATDKGSYYLFELTFKVEPTIQGKKPSAPARRPTPAKTAASSRAD